MKKLAIAGASAVLAALPVAGVFAADPVTTPNAHTDILNITIDSVCAFGFDTDPSNTGSTIEVTGVARADGDGTWKNASDQDSTTTDQNTGNTTATLSKTMVNGTFSTNLGTTTLGVYCNDHDGYNITSSFVDGTGAASANGGALAGATSGETIPAAALVENENAFPTTTSGWTYKVAKTTGTANVGGVVQGTFGNWSGTAGTIVSANTEQNGVKMTDNTGDKFTITYGVTIDQAQAADTYTGGIKYTLAQLPTA